MPIRDAQAHDLDRIVGIYNAAIPERLATADTEPVTVESREAWFGEFDPTRRPLWVFVPGQDAPIQGWLSLRSFYGRPAYATTVEVGVYVDPASRGHGVARALLTHALDLAPALQIRTMLAFVFGHNAPSLALFERAGFARWGRLPRVALLDGVERDLVILGRRTA